MVVGVDQAPLHRTVPPRTVRRHEPGSRPPANWRARPARHTPGASASARKIAEATSSTLRASRSPRVLSTPDLLGSRDPSWSHRPMMTEDMGRTSDFTDTHARITALLRRRGSGPTKVVAGTTLWSRGQGGPFHRPRLSAGVYPVASNRKRAGDGQGREMPWSPLPRCGASRLART